MLTTNEQLFRTEEDRIVYAALNILERRIKQNPISLSNPRDVREFLRVTYSDEEREVFSVMWVDSQNRLIEFEPMFYGTINQASVYPREVVKSALAHNAAACIFAHNHPSGTCEPSRADEVLTASLKTALSLVDVKVLDHMVVTTASTFSFAERGLL